MGRAPGLAVEPETTRTVIAGGPWPVRHGQSIAPRNRGEHRQMLQLHAVLLQKCINIQNVSRYGRIWLGNGKKYQFIHETCHLLDSMVIYYIIRRKVGNFQKLVGSLGVWVNVKKYQNFTFRSKEGRKRLNKAKKWRYTGGGF